MYRLNYEKKDLGPSYAIAVASMIVASLVLGLIFGSNATGWKFWLMQALFTLFIGGSAFLYAAITKTNVFVATKITAKPGYAHVLWGCLAVTFLIACMTPINNVLLDGIEAMGLKRPSVQFDDNLAGLLIVACMLPAFCEEVVFRGTVAQSLRQGNKLGALAISGALFALFHANPAQTIHQFVLGAFLTLLVYRSGSLWTSVIVHFFNNALVVALSYTPVGRDEFWSFTTNTGVVIACLCVGIIGFAACVFGYIATTKSAWNSIYNVSGTSDLNEDGANNPENTTPSASKEHNIRSLVLLIVAIVICVTLWVSNLFTV
ncbi:MAG: CPBP family intramembrane metalloprotease [Clostridiales bacterium]|nr:CPBP family intramembrane metalloprotease [Clostridiales bacterium]